MFLSFFLYAWIFNLFRSIWQPSFKPLADADFSSIHRAMTYFNGMFSISYFQTEWSKSIKGISFIYIQNTSFQYPKDGGKWCDCPIELTKGGDGQELVFETQVEAHFFLLLTFEIDQNHPNLAEYFLSNLKATFLQLPWAAQNLCMTHSTPETALIRRFT